MAGQYGSGPILQPVGQYDDNTIPVPPYHDNSYPVMQNESYFPRQDNYNGNYNGNNNNNYQQGNGSGNNNKSNNGNKNNTNSNNKNRSPIPERLEGFTLKRATPKPGERRTWDRMVRTPSSLSEGQLRAEVRQRALRNQRSPYGYHKLESAPRTAVDLVLQQVKRSEKDKNAEWVIQVAEAEYEPPSSVFSFSKGETIGIMVILKRRDKDPELRRKLSKGGRSSKPQSSGYVEIIESSSLSKKPDDKSKSNNNGNGNGNKSGSNNNNNNNYGNNSNGLRKSKSDDSLIAYQHGRGFDNYNQNSQPLPPYQPQNNNVDYNPYPPLAPIPINSGPLYPPPVAPDPWDQVQQYPALGPPPLNRNMSARQPGDINPFDPDPHLMPTAYDSFDDNDYHTANTHNTIKPRRSSRNLTRRNSSRHNTNKETKRTERKLSKLEDQVDDLNNQLQKYRLDDRGGGGHSSDSTYGEDSIFSRRGNVYDQDFTPPSSPRSGFSRISPERSGKSQRARYRSSRYRDADAWIEPAYTERERDRDRDRDRGIVVRKYSYSSNRGTGGGGRRPKLHHAHTYDDYPDGRGGEPRYPGLSSRRMTEYSVAAGDRDRYEWEDDERRMRSTRDGREEREVRDRLRKRSGVLEYDSLDEGVVGGAGGWDFERERRTRRRSVGGGARYHFD